LRQTSHYPNPPDRTMIDTLSQKLSCLTYGVQSSTVTEMVGGPTMFARIGVMRALNRQGR
jgi:hypothetical protein